MIRPLIVERINRLIQEIRGRDSQRVRWKLLKFDRDVANIAHYVRRLEADVKDVGRSCASNSSSLSKLDSALGNLSARVDWLNECAATLIANQEGHRAVLESLQKAQSMVDTSELARRVESLEEGLAEVVSLLELPPSDLLSIAFRKRPRK
jgi:chromosome segregation ATPase